MTAPRVPCRRRRLNKFLNEGQDAVSRGKKKRKLSTTRQDGPYYAFKPLLKGVCGLFQ